MLIVLRHIKHPVYDDIYKSIERKYNIKYNDEEDILVNGIPIKYNDELYIVINYAYLEISGLELTNKSYEMEYIVNDDIYGEIIIRNTMSVHDIEMGHRVEFGNCYYDEHLNIMFVKFQDVRIEYIDISNYKLFFDNSKNIIFEWIDETLENNTIRFNNNKLIFENKFINLPKVPLIVTSKEELTENIKLPITGAKALDTDKNLVGMVSYSNDNNVTIIPTFLISRMIEYLYYKPMLFLNFNYNLVKINCADGTKIYGLNYNKIKKRKYMDKDNISYVICKINNCKINNKEMIFFEKFFLPISTYLWLFADNKVNIQGLNIKKNNLNISDTGYELNFKDDDKLRFYNYELKLDVINNSCLSISKLNFVKYKLKYLIEVNEKIMQIFKKVIQSNNDYDYFFDYIIRNKLLNKKIIIILDENLNIKIIKNIMNKEIKNMKMLVALFLKKKNLATFIANY